MKFDVYNHLALEIHVMRGKLRLSLTLNSFIIGCLIEIFDPTKMLSQIKGILKNYAQSPVEVFLHYTAHIFRPGAQLYMQGTLVPYLLTYLLTYSCGK